MSGFVYLIRNKDLYKIGITQNLEQRMKALKPDEILKTVQTEDYLELEKQLHKRYKDVRIPQTEYFRLTESQLENCKKALNVGKIIKTDGGFMNTINSIQSFFNVSYQVIGYSLVIVFFGACVLFVFTVGYTVLKPFIWLLGG